MSTRDEVRRFLDDTPFPPELVSELLAGAPELWLASAAPAVLASDLTLCHPELGPDEVRASAGCIDQVWRLTVVAHDRPGLLADTAAAVDVGGFSVASGSVVSWGPHGLALHALSLAGPSPSLDGLQQLTQRIRFLESERTDRTNFRPDEPAVVRRVGEDSGDWIVRLSAPDQPGLLAATCRWFADNGSSIRAASIGSSGGRAEDVFVVSGSPDLDRLAAELSPAN
jgi:UTP:GlnB (protein PII) uridylyltransferase